MTKIELRKEINDVTARIEIIDMYMNVNEITDALRAEIKKQCMLTIKALRKLVEEAEDDD